MTKQEQASDFLNRCDALGISIEVSPNWVKYQPPLPVEMLMEAMDLQDEISAELAARERLQ